MKTLILLSGLLLGLVLGLFPNLERPRPLWWQIIAIALVVITIAMGLLPPLAGNLQDAVIVGRATPEANVPVVGKVLSFDAAAGTAAFVDRNGRQVTLLTGGFTLIAGVEQILFLQRQGNDLTYSVINTGGVSPAVTYPYIPALEERARNIFYHVPMAWVGMLAYFVSMWYAVRFLRSGDIRFDGYSAEAAALGTVFTILATTTGMIWAKFNWGAFWNWDPRQTSIFVLLLIYGAYFSLRSAIPDPQKKARLASVYAMLSAIAAIFLIYIMPRLVDGLHPGSADSGNAGPVLSAEDDTLNPVKQAVFAISFAAFSVVFYWLLSLRMRIINLRMVAN